MDNFLPPLQKNFNDIRDFLTDNTLNNQLDETINFLIEYLNINNGYIFLFLNDHKIVVSSSSSSKHLVPSVFSEFDTEIISKNEVCSYSNLQVEINIEETTKIISYFVGFPINIFNNNVTGAICFYDSSDKELTQKEIKTIEFVIKQLQVFLDNYFEKNSLKRSIKSSLDRFDLFIENSKEVFYELQTDGTILFVSESWTSNVGHNVNEIIGKNTASLIHPDDVLHVSDFLSKLIVNQKSTQEVVYRLLHKDGHYVWHSSDVKLIEREGEYFYIGNCRDITEFINAQNEISFQKEFYEKILDRLPIDLAVWDINHKYLYLNREAIKNDELRKYIIGKDDFEYAVHTGRDDSFAKKRRELFNKAINSKQIIEWEDVILSLSGEQFYHTRKYIPIFDEDGNFDMMTGSGIVTGKQIGRAHV